MVHTLTISHTTNDGGTQSNSISETGTAYLEVAEPVANSETDYEIICAIDVSEIALLYIVSDQDVTLETNSGSEADDTLALKANEPAVWHTNSVHACPLGTDVTSVFITNASGAVANVKIRVLTDATPE